MLLISHHFLSKSCELLVGSSTSQRQNLGGVSEPTAPQSIHDPLLDGFRNRLRTCRNSTAAEVPHEQSFVDQDRQSGAASFAAAGQRAAMGLGNGQSCPVDDPHWDGSDVARRPAAVRGAGTPTRRAS